MPAVVYTMFGGVQAVTWTDVKIMVLIVFGLFAVIVGGAARPARRRRRDRRPGDRRGDRPAAQLRFLVRSHQPVHVLVGHDRGALPVLLVLRHRSEPGAALSDRAIGGRGAALAADERVLEDSAAGRGAAPRRAGVRVLRLHTAADALQQPSQTSGCARAPRRPSTRRCRREFDSALRRRARGAALRARRGATGRRCRTARPRRKRRSASARPRSAAVRGQAPALVEATTGDRAFTDVNYIIPTFILTQLPIGLIGLLIVAILLAATDTIAGELNSLSTATVIDFYRRCLRPDATDAHYLTVSKVATGLWGLFACAVAVWAAELGSLIEVVNRFGSFFYGSILGVFILAIASAGDGERRIRRPDRRHELVAWAATSRTSRSSGTTSSARWRSSSSGWCGQ